MPTMEGTDKNIAGHETQAFYESNNDLPMPHYHNKITTQKDQVTTNQTSKITCIDSIVPISHHPIVIDVETGCGVLG